MVGQDGKSRLEALRWLAGTLLLSTIGALSVKAELIPIDPNTVSSPPYSYLRDSLRRLGGEDIPPNRYLTFLGSWENNGEANWERSSWWGRFYIDCQDGTFKVTHFRHHHPHWRLVQRNYTALFAFERLCVNIRDLNPETTTIDRLNSEFTREYHDRTAPFKAIF